MIRRLVEAHHRQFSSERTGEAICFWLREMTSPELLQQLALENSVLLPDLARFRPWFLTTDMHDLQAVVRELEAERERERLADIAYWEPLKRELGELRVNKRSKDR